MLTAIETDISNLKKYLDSNLISVDQLKSNRNSPGTRLEDTPSRMIEIILQRIDSNISKLENLHLPESYNLDIINLLTRYKELNDKMQK